MRSMAERPQPLKITLTVDGQIVSFHNPTSDPFLRDFEKNTYQVQEVMSVPGTSTRIPLKQCRAMDTDDMMMEWRTIVATVIKWIT